MHPQASVHAQITMRHNVPLLLLSSAGLVQNALGFMVPPVASSSRRSPASAEVCMYV